MTPENVGNKVHLRVELQGLWRLPRSNAIVFSIRGYLIKMDELVTVPKWGRRLHRVLKTLPDAIADYKGTTRYRQTTIDWLAKYDDGHRRPRDVGPIKRLPSPKSITRPFPFPTRRTATS